LPGGRAAPWCSRLLSAEVARSSRGCWKAARTGREDAVELPLSPTMACESACSINAARADLHRPALAGKVIDILPYGRIVDNVLQSFI